MYIGIVKHNGVLRAEIGPKKFRHAESKVTENLLADASLLRLRIENGSKPANLAFNPNGPVEDQKALDDLELAQAALDMGLVKLEDFPLPEPPTDMRDFCNQARINPKFVKALENNVNDVKGRSDLNTPVDFETQTRADWYLALSKPLGTKSLPAAILDLKL